MAKSPGELIADLRAELSTVRQDNAIFRERLEAALRDLKDVQAERKSDANELKEVRQENALLRQRLDDHIKRVETWSGRLWALVVMMTAAALSLASGLIVALTKK